MVKKPKDYYLDQNQLFKQFTRSWTISGINPSLLDWVANSQFLQPLLLIIIIIIKHLSPRGLNILVQNLITTTLILQI